MAPGKNSCMIMRNDSENTFIIIVKVVLTHGPPEKVLATPEGSLYHTVRAAGFQSIDMVCVTHMRLKK